MPAKGYKKVTEVTIITHPAASVKHNLISSPMSSAPAAIEAPTKPGPSENLDCYGPDISQNFELDT